MMREMTSIRGRSSARLALGALMLACALPACKSSATPGTEAGKRAGATDQAHEVELEAVTEVSAEDSIEASGTLAPDEQVTVAAKVAGRLSSISVDVASPVKRGEPIAQIETSDYSLQAERAAGALGEARALLGLGPNDKSSRVDPEQTAIVRQARANLGEAEANVARMRALSREGVSTGMELDAAEAALVRAQSTLQSSLEEVRIRQAQLEQRRSDLGSAEQRLSDTVLRSPLDGVVQARMGHVGEYFTAGAPVVQIVRVDTLRLKLTIPEREATKVRQEQAVEVRVDGDPQVYMGRVARVAPSLDTDSRSLLIEADMKNPGHLRPGSFAHCRVIVGSRRAATVASTAIISFAGLTKVIMVQDGKAVEKQVTLGKKLGDRVEILSGLKAGDQVVVRPGSLKQGQPVRVKTSV
jgi:RND family efflux transporter MFP subunit